MTSIANACEVGTTYTRVRCWLMVAYMPGAVPQQQCAMRVSSLHGMCVGLFSVSYLIT